MENEVTPNQTLTQAEDTINIRHYWHIILERRWLVVAAFISVFALSLIYLFKATPIYLATARLRIDPETESILQLEGIRLRGNQDQDYLQTQYKTLLSRSLIATVIERLDLRKDERYAKPDRDIVELVADDIQVVPIRLSRLVEVKAEHPDRNRAAKIVNTLVDEFIDRNLAEKKHDSAMIATRLSTEADTQRAEMEKAGKALQDYLEKEKEVSFEDRGNILLQSLMQYQAEYDRAKSEAETSQKIVEEIEKLIREGTPLDSIHYVRSDPQIQALQNELHIHEAKFEGLKKIYGPEFEDYKQTEAIIERLQASIKQQSQSLIQSLRNKAFVASQTANQMDGLLQQSKRQQLDLKKKKITYDVLKQKVDQTEKTYSLVLDRLIETEISGNNKVSNIHIDYKAEPMIKPVKPRKVLTILLGIVGGLGVAIGLAFFVNYLDDSIKSQDDVETYLRLPFLGYVPNIKINNVVDRDLQAHKHPQSNAAEGFRTIRATISLTHKPDKFRILSITSTIPSEGKSLVASNLAIVTAQTGLRTLLVDADLRRPSVHKAFQLHSPVGLSSFLTEETDELDQIVHHSEVPNLDVVCCGAVPSTPSELIGSNRMAEFLQRVRGKYDRIVLDCPPISAVSDPLVIAAMSDGVVFVTKFNKIRREHARKSVNRVQNAGIHILGVVLNDIDFEGKDSYYYSYYYYQNRYYASHYKTSPDRSKSKSKEKEPALAKARNGGGNGDA